MNFNSITHKDWELKFADNNKILYLREKFSISEILSRLLVLRKFSNSFVQSANLWPWKAYIKSTEILSNMLVASFNAISTSLMLCNLPKNFKYLSFRDWTPIDSLFIPIFFNSKNFLLSYELGFASRVISIFLLKPNIWLDISIQFPFLYV